MPRPRNDAAEAAVLAHPDAPTADLAATLGIPERTIRDVRARLGIAPPPSRAGGARGDVRVLMVRVTAAQMAELEAYAEHLGVEVDDAIKDNLLGQCWDCSEPAILDARDRPLCEACRERTGCGEAPAD